ncbi:hypothetical protein D3C81_1400580 [compost metagenome]
MATASARRGCQRPFRRAGCFGAGRCVRADEAGLADLAGHWNPAPDGDFRLAHFPAGRAALCTGSWTRAAGRLAAADSLASLRLCARAAGGVELRADGRFRDSRAARLRDDFPGAALASALPPSGAVAAAAWRPVSGTAVRSAGQPDAGLLVVVRCRGATDLRFCRPAGQMGLVAHLVAGAVADGARTDADAAGSGPAGEP